MGGQLGGMHLHFPHPCAFEKRGWRASHDRVLPGSQARRGAPDRGAGSQVIG